MIEYVFSANPDDRVIAKASQIIRNGGLVCFPTETKWVVAANPYHKASVDKLYRLRHVENTKHFTILCHSFQKAMEVAFIPDSAFSVLKRVLPGSYTFIFEAQKKITRYLKASKIDHQVGIRFPPTKLCQKLLDTMDDVLICTSVNQELLNQEPDMPIYSALIEEELGHLLDLIIDSGETEFAGLTSIVDFSSGEPVVQRRGVGDLSFFER